MEKRKPTIYLILFLSIIIVALTAGKPEAQLPWPVEPTDSDHPIGNSLGEFQEYTGAPYLHTGIDIREDCAPNGPWVRSVTGGTLTLVDNPNDPTYRYNRVEIVTGTTTYRYGHLDHNSIQNDVTNAVANGTPFPANTRISQIVDWAVFGNFHHLHFDIMGGGNFMNPFTEGLTPEADNAPPQVHKILICRNNSNTFLTKPGTGCWVVDGDLDIIARASDTDPPLPAIFWQGNIGVYRIEYSITELTGTCTHNVAATELYRFDDFPTAGNGSAQAAIIYKNAPPADSESDYWVSGGEEYYYIVTNVDSTGNLSEANGYWDTDGGDFPDGLYQVSVTAYDFVGNHHTKSEIVFVKNNPASPSPVELLIRDREGDTGSIPSNPHGEAFWVSPDIRVDAPTLGKVNATGLKFGPKDHDNPIYNKENLVYIRVHNIGCAKSGKVKIRLYSADPAGWIPESDWNEIEPTVEKFISKIASGSSVEYKAPWIPTLTAKGHRCLLVRLESPEDPIMSDYNVPGENNIAMKNVIIVDPTPGSTSQSEFFITNLSNRPAKIQLTIDRTMYPKDGQVIIEFPFNYQLYLGLRQVPGITIAYKEPGVMGVNIWRGTVTLGAKLSPGERILARIVLVLPDRLEVVWPYRAYTVQITQSIGGITTGGVTFVVPREKWPW